MAYSSPAHHAASSGHVYWVDDDDVYSYIRWRLELEGETENTGVCTKERKGVTAAVLMATPCTNSLGGESGGLFPYDVSYCGNTLKMDWLKHYPHPRRAPQTCGP